MSKTEVVLSEVSAETGVSFGTSGIRGLISSMTDRVCYAYTQGFLKYLREQRHIGFRGRVALAGDLRPSTPRIMRAVATAVSDMGYDPVNCGYIPTPAVTLYGIENNIPSVMITGSHIPEDRNGIKFNRPDGEVLKSDEKDILAQVVSIPSYRFNEEGELIDESVLPDVISIARDNYIRRYLDFFPHNCLQGASIGLYEHSSVLRDIAAEVLVGLGARVTRLARSEQFVSVDTEAVRPKDVQLAKEWASEYEFDCIISADGDGDRPLISDEQGNWLRGDVAGILSAKFLGVDVVVTPINSNSAVEKSHYFTSVKRTRIGSPYVIEAMQKVASEFQGVTIAGYEANGGFLVGSDMEYQGNKLASLPTRDALIVPLVILMSAMGAGMSIASLVKTLPARFTASGRIKDFSKEKSRLILSSLSSGDMKNDFSNFGKLLGDAVETPFSVDVTDGVRFTLDNGDIIHFRASGNAPELRCYTESDSQDKAEFLNQHSLERIKNSE